MERVTLTLDLPDDLIRDAEEFDLLQPLVVESLLRAELDRQVMALVDAEVKAVRAEKRISQSGPYRS